MLEKRFNQLGMPDIERFENYLPTAFSSELTLLQKVNKIIQDLIRNFDLTNEMVDYLNNFIETFDENLYETVDDILNEWLKNDKLAKFIRDLINEEVIEARTDYLGKTYGNLKERLDSEKADIVEVTNQLEHKANKDEVTNIMTPKGNKLYNSLPTTGNTIGDYYYCPDGDGVNGPGNYVWNGTAWYFGGTGDEGYNKLKSDLGDVFSVQKNIFSEAELLKRGAYASPKDDGSIYLNTNESYSAYRFRVSENSKYTFTNAKFWYRANGSSKAIGELQTDGTTIDSETAYYIIFSFNHNDYPTDSFKIVKGETLETGVIFTEESGIPKLKADVELLKDRYGRFVAKANSMASEEYITLPTTNVNRNHVYVFSAKITNASDFRLRISHGASTYMSSFVDINPTDVNVVNYVPSMVNSPHVHGLSIGEYIKVIINVKDHNDATISISSGGNTYTFADKWYGFNNAQPMVYVYGGSFADCEFTVSFEEIGKDLFMFGDSYFGTENKNRWVSYLVDNGYTNQLINAYPGESSTEAEIALNNLLEVAKPKYILWCLGMNDGSDDTTYTAKWKHGIDVVLAHCSRLGIKPIFATIPTVPTINHEKKNAYIRALCEARQYDYIDFAKAVGSDENDNWYSGMLSPDGVHPTELGAFALYSQAIIDCPKLIEK